MRLAAVIHKNTMNKWNIFYGHFYSDIIFCFGFRCIRSLCVGRGSRHRCEFTICPWMRVCACKWHIKMSHLPLNQAEPIHHRNPTENESTCREENQIKLNKVRLFSRKILWLARDLYFICHYFSSVSSDTPPNPMVLSPQLNRSVPWFCSCGFQEDNGFIVNIDWIYLDLKKSLASGQSQSLCKNPFGLRCKRKKLERFIADRSGRMKLILTHFSLFFKLPFLNDEC